MQNNWRDARLIRKRYACVMVTYVIDTAAAIQQLRDASCDEKLATAIVSLVAQSQEQLATKADVENLKAEVKSALAVLETKIDATDMKVDAAEARLTDKINAVEARLVDKINAAEARLVDKINTLGIKNRLWMITGIVTVVGLIKAFDYVLPLLVGF